MTEEQIINRCKQIVSDARYYQKIKSDEWWKKEVYSALDGYNDLITEIEDFLKDLISVTDES